MNKKLIELLKEKCKDFGLTEKAIESLSQMGAEGLTDDATDEDIEKKADSLVPFAKLMQAEITRKTAPKPSPTPTPKPKEGEGEDKPNGGSEDMPAWAKAMQETMNAMKAENDALKAEKKANDRKAVISDTAKKLGIPSFLMKNFAIGDDADVEKELTQFKQDLVTNNLMPKDATEQQSGFEAQLKESAEAWAKSLPDK